MKSFSDHRTEIQRRWFRRAIRPEIATSVTRMQYTKGQEKLAPNPDLTIRIRCKNFSALIEHVTCTRMSRTG
jgi:hypothetical protein